MDSDIQKKCGDGCWGGQLKRPIIAIMTWFDDHKPSSLPDNNNNSNKNDRERERESMREYERATNMLISIYNEYWHWQHT